MFGLSTSFIQAQGVIPLSYAISQFSGARIPSGKSFKSIAKPSCLSGVTRHNTQETNLASNHHDSTETNISIAEECLQAFQFSHNEIKKIVTPELLKDLSLIGAPKQSIYQFNQARHYSHMTGRKSNWQEHHSSFNSFTENKNGYPIGASPISSMVHKILSDSKNKKLLSSILFDLKANFHTRRSIERINAQQISISNKLKSFNIKGSTIPAEKESSPKLYSLLEETPEDSQKNLKVAFAEGYLAADPKKPSKFSKFVNSFQNVFVFVAIITLLVLLWGGVGGTIFKMQVGNRNEVQPEEITVSFDDVRGVDEAKHELQEIVQFLKYPDKFTSLGAELPKGVLLVGPPGTGKTLLARAVAGEAGVPFFHAAGPEFDEILVGQGARRVRDLFMTAKARAPCVVFIDEIDSVGAKRTNSVLHPYANQTINQLLAEMDGFNKTEGVIVLGATNRRGDLDQALLRPGRFDVEVHVPVPDLAGRKDIFEYYLGKVKVSAEVCLDVLARGTTGFTGADIKNVVNQGALRAAADLIDSVSMKHLEDARDKVLMGPEKKSRIPDEEANLITAYHESGHTLVSYFTKDSHPLHKVTIISRGSALGHTAYIPAKEQYHMTKSQMIAQMDSLMGGRAAEEIIYGDEFITSGGSSDLKRATNIASHMVKDFGMSDRVGLRTFDSESSSPFMQSGESLGHTTKESIDIEIKRLLQESYDRAKIILKNHAKEHKALADALMVYETLDADDIKTIIEGRPLTKKI